MGKETHRNMSVTKKKKKKLDDDLFEIIIYNIISLSIVNTELNKSSVKNKVIDSIIVKNINYILNNIFILSFGNIQKLLFIIDFILNDEGVYYKFSKLSTRENVIYCNSTTIGATDARNARVTTGTNTGSTTRDIANYVTSGKVQINGMQKGVKKNVHEKEKTKKTVAASFTDTYSLNNYINDIFIYIEEKNTYLSIFHFDYIFEDIENYQRSFLQKYENYTFKKFFRDVMELSEGVNETNNKTRNRQEGRSECMGRTKCRNLDRGTRKTKNLLYIKKTKYEDLYKELIKYHKDNFNLLEKSNCEDDGLLSYVGGDYISSASTSNETTRMSDTEWANGDNILSDIVKTEKDVNVQNSNNYKNRKEARVKNTEEYTEYDVISREKIKKLYKYKKEKCKLIKNNNFVNKKSYIPINLFPNNDLYISNIKFQTVSSSTRVKVHLLFLYTNIILVFNLLNSSLHLWVYKFISFLLNVLNNFNCKCYFYLDNSLVLSHFNKGKMFILNKQTWDHKFVTKVNNSNQAHTLSVANNLSTKRYSILQTFVEKKNDKKDNKMNINFPYTNCGYIVIYDNGKKTSAKKLYFHHYVSIQILKYYSILSLLEIENYYKGILSCLLGDVYNRTISTICKIERKEKHYVIFPASKNNAIFKNSESLKNNNIDLYALIIELTTLRCNNNTEDVVINSLRYLYFFVLFNYMNILFAFSSIDKYFIKEEEAFPFTGYYECNAKNGGESECCYEFINTKKCHEDIEAKRDEESLKCREVRKISDEINSFITENHIRLELQEFRKSAHVLERVKKNYYFSGSLITLPFYVNMNTFQMFHQYEIMEKSSRNNEATNESINDQNGKAEKNEKNNKSMEMSQNCKDLIRKRISNVLRNNIDLIFHFSSYVPLFVNNFIDILKKRNYFLYENNSYRFAICVKYLYMLYEELSQDIIQELYEKIMLVIKNEFYTQISKIIIIYIFSFFLNKKYILHLCIKDIKQFYPNFSDTEDLAIVKYYFVLKIIHYNPIAINLRDIYTTLYTYHNYVIIMDPNENVNSKGEHSFYYDNFFLNFPPEKDSSNKQHHKTRTTSSLLQKGKKKKCHEKYALGAQNEHCKKQIIIHLSSRENFNISCQKNKYPNENDHFYNTLVGELSNYMSAKMLDGTSLRMIHGSFPDRCTKGLILNKERERENSTSTDDRNVQCSVELFYPKDEKARNSMGRKLLGQFFEECITSGTSSDIFNDNLIKTNGHMNRSAETGNSVHAKKIYLLIFAYYLLKHYNQFSELKKWLKWELLNVLLSNMKEVNKIHFMLQYLYEKKDIELFCFIQNAILNWLTKIKPKYKIMNFLVFLFYLVKIKYTNIKSVMRILNTVLRKYKFNIKVYITIFKIIKTVLQYHDISDSYQFIISILKYIRECSYEYLHTTCTYYMNIIENKISFMECVKFDQKYQDYHDILSGVYSPKGRVPGILHYLQLNKIYQKNNSINVKYINSENASNFIKLKIHKLDRKNVLSLDDNGSTIFYSQYDEKCHSKNCIKKKCFHSNEYYNKNDFNSDEFYSIYKEDSYSLKNYCTYITNSDHYLYFPFILRYTRSSKKEKKYFKDTNKIDSSENGIIEPIKLRNISPSKYKNGSLNKERAANGDKLWNPNEKLFCLNVCFVHKADFVNIHNVYIPYTKLGRSCSPDRSDLLCKKKKCNMRVPKHEHDMQINRKTTLLRRLTRKKKIFLLKKKYFYKNIYSYILYSTRVKNIKSRLTRKLKRGRYYRKSKRCNLKKSKRHFSGQHVQINLTHSTNFADLKRDIIKKEIYKTTCKLKKKLLLMRGKYSVKGKNRKTNSSRYKYKEQNINSYKILIKIRVKLLIQSNFYAYVIYLNREKKTFKTFLGKYNLNFIDFFLPFKASIQHWKNIFEDVWNGNIGKIYKSAKYLIMTSGNVLQIINKKLHQFLIKENINIKIWNIHNFPQYNMHISKNYYPSGNHYYAYRNKKKKINSYIYDEFYVDNYSLNGSESDMVTNEEINRNQKYFYTNNIRAKKNKIYYLLYKPKNLSNLPKEPLSNSLNDSSDNASLGSNGVISGKINCAENEDQSKMNNNEHVLFTKRRIKYKIHLKPYRITGEKLKCKNKVTLRGDNIMEPKISQKRHSQKNNHPNYKKNNYLSWEMKKKQCNPSLNNSKINTDIIKKFVGIFLPPSHHLLMVFHIHEKFTMVQIRADNLSVLNYLNPFFDKCKLVHEGRPTFVYVLCKQICDDLFRFHKLVIYAYSHLYNHFKMCKHCHNIYLIFENDAKLQILHR
ncbi:hypothetical protein, conserved [Plasmodium gonderi]|uniref:Uncharacterized protein n=1 Tax=Plasmodium gonderi TaxID=77519 RepID=A0A1Y1JM93_PLAGO|nr:hypothetical protein, conserved [Plasmodium gonderi]GAW83579.1 hypothetical protein, conserved [Plasmodium gonderi]